MTREIKRRFLVDISDEVLSRGFPGVIVQNYLAIPDIGEEMIIRKEENFVRMEWD